MSHRLPPPTYDAWIATNGATTFHRIEAFPRGEQRFGWTMNNCGRCVFEGACVLDHALVVNAVTPALAEAFGWRRVNEETEHIEETWVPPRTCPLFEIDPAVAPLPGPA